MRIGIIGGGASGLVAAYFAAKAGAEVTIFEKNHRLGKKILATGNGKCNLSNLDFSTGYYHSMDPQRIDDFFSRFSVQDTMKMFSGLGLLVKDKNGYLYPECEQAAVVVDVFTYALAQLHVEVKNGFYVTEIQKQKHSIGVVGWKEESAEDATSAQKEKKKKNSPKSKKTDDKNVSRKEEKHYVDRLIIACGSKAGLTKEAEAEENGIALLSFLHLSCAKRVPSLVQLKCRENFFKQLAGVRCHAEIVLELSATNELHEKGELQLTDYGISGIPVFQLSRYASYALLEQKSVSGYIDFLPEIRLSDWEKLMQNRRTAYNNRPAEQFLVGTVNKKIIPVVLKEAGIRGADRIDQVSDSQFRKLIHFFKRFPITVTETNPFSSAQVCAGGIRLNEVSDSLELIKCPGIYVTGELLDIDGRCGGYNLQWAWTSGAIAAKAATRGIN